MSEPRITPGSRAQIGRLNSLIVAAIWRAAGTERPPNLFTTLARHRRLFRAWLRFGGALMPRGRLPRVDTELVILRVAHNTRAEYERRHHEKLGRESGLSDEQIAAIDRDDVSGAGWSERQRLLLRATDEMHLLRDLSDELWAELRGEFPDEELIELCMLVGHYEMLAMTIASLRIQPDEQRSRPRRSPGGDGESLAGRRVLITGAARGIGAATARRLHERGARVVLAGIEPELLGRVAADCGNALAVVCDVRNRDQVEGAVEAAVEQLGGLDVVIANAGVAAQLPILGGNPEVFERTMEVNLLGVYYTLRAAAPHIAHERGYALAISSLAAAVHAPLLGAYSASKAGVEALADTLRIELHSTGARVGVAYFAQLETDMTRRGFGTEAAQHISAASGPFDRVTPLEVGVKAIVHGIENRSRQVVAPGWVAGVLPVRMLVQRLVDRVSLRGLDRALEIARTEDAPLTTNVGPRAGSAESATLHTGS
jgi:NAD(P)-dependent dehydrogenase (short-subunit alcohol dehydrogenase family)/alkylhydroperoxidase family enzyme